MINHTALPMVLFAAAFASVIAPWCWLQGVQRIGSSQATLFMNLVPVFTVIVSFIFLGKVPTWYHLIGGSAVLIGLLLAQVKFTSMQTALSEKVV